MDKKARDQMTRMKMTQTTTPKKVFLAREPDRSTPVPYQKIKGKK